MIDHTFGILSFRIGSENGNGSIEPLQANPWWFNLNIVKENLKKAGWKQDNDGQINQINLK